MSPDPEPMASARVEAYLDQLLVPLARNLSPFHRDDLRRELREHLWGRIDAYRGLGHAEDDSVTKALQQFGGAEDFFEQWRQEWRKAARSTVRGEVKQAMLAGLRLSLPFLLLACAPVILWVSLSPIYGHPLPRLTLWLGNHSAVIGPPLAWLDFVVLPALLGIGVGRRTARRAGTGLFAAMTVEIVLGALLDGTGLKLWPHHSALSDILGQAALLEFAWLPIACLTAAFTGWWTQQRMKKRQIA